MNIKQRLEDRFRQGSLESALIILESVERYSGESGLLVQWARLYLRTAEREANEEEGFRLCA